MTDLERTNSEAAEQFEKGLLEFVEKTEFGTPQYQAVSDYFDLKLLYDSLRQEQKNLLSNNDDPEKRLAWESQARVTEQKIALLEHSISQSDSRFEGYSNAYTRVDREFDQLASVLTAKAQELLVDDEAQRRHYAAENYDSAFHTALDTVFKIRQGSSSKENK